eukprot:361803-Chlamydomonas_euryale.AAC.4
MFNVFDAGEFWLSCVTRSTALHLCAISNRIYCAGAILHYWEQNRVALKLEDPRLWRDAKGRLPVEIAQVCVCVCVCVVVWGGNACIDAPLRPTLPHTTALQSHW